MLVKAYGARSAPANVSPKGQQFGQACSLRLPLVHLQVFKLFFCLNVRSKIFFCLMAIASGPLRKNSPSNCRGSLACYFRYWSSLTSSILRASSRGQGKLKYGAPRGIRDDPQLPIVGIDNRTADRQAHPHTAGFCREEGVEYPLDLLRADSCSGVGNRYPYDAAVVANLGSHA